MANKNSGGTFDWSDFHNTIKNAFPYISDDYWNMLQKTSSIGQYIDWDKFGQHIRDQAWPDHYTDIVNNFLKQHTKK